MQIQLNSFLIHPVIYLHGVLSSDLHFAVLLTFVHTGTCSKYATIEQQNANPEYLSEVKLLRWFRRMTYLMLGLSLINWFGYMACPTKKYALLIVAGGVTVTYLANDSLAKTVPHEVLGFVTSELKSMAKEASVEIKSMSEKDKFLDGIKGLTPEQVLNKMKSDTSFTRMYTNFVLN